MISRIGLDIAKRSFQVHAIDADGRTALKKKIKREELLDFFATIPPTLVGLEAGSSAYYWAREIEGLGHQARIIPPQYVKPFVIRGKNDPNDAAAICEAMIKENIRFVSLKSPMMQAVMSVHRSRTLLIKQRVQLVNAIRALVAEFGLEVPANKIDATQWIVDFRSAKQPRIPRMAAKPLSAMCSQVRNVDKKVGELEDVLRSWSKSDPIAQRLLAVPGIGLMTATALAGTVADMRRFPNARSFAAWLGLTPLLHSTGGRARSTRMSGMGDQYIRRLLVSGMISRIGWARRLPERADPWLTQLLARKPTRVAAVALANKTARIAWAMIVKDEQYRPVRSPLHSDDGVATG